MRQVIHTARAFWGCGPFCSATISFIKSKRIILLPFESTRPITGRTSSNRLPMFIQNYNILAGLAIFMLMFGWAWGLTAWGVQTVAYVLLNSSINSLCHMIGYRNFDNLATNIQLVAFLTGREGLHNNHHEFPTSARFALRGREIDLAWPVIRLLERCGLAKIDRLPIAKAA